MTLQFGLDTFGDITAGADGSLLSHAQVIRNVVSEAVLAEQVGVDFFGVGEHHRADYAVSAPDVVLSAIAGQTKQIRLGSAATVLASDDPVRVFQRFSTLDALSNGRAEVILGRGWFTESFRLFGNDVSQYETLFNEKLELFASLLRRESVTWQGTSRPSLRRERVYPPVEGKPLKTWIAVGATPESVLRAARYDLPLMLAVIGGEAKRFSPFVQIYRSAFQKLGKPEREIAVHSTGYIADTDAQAREEFWPAYKLMRDALGTERGWPPISRAQFDVEADRGSLYVGSPVTVAQRIAETLTTLGASRFDMKYSVGQLGHDELLRSVELYGREVIPLVRRIVSGENLREA
jgi:probable LLM family oxidoreductase